MTSPVNIYLISCVIIHSLHGATSGPVGKRANDKPARRNDVTRDVTNWRRDERMYGARDDDRHSVRLPRDWEEAHEDEIEQMKLFGKKESSVSMWTSGAKSTKREEVVTSRVDKKTAFKGDRCDAYHYNCNDDVTAQCINRLFVCDGFSDCRNGADEKYCDMPILEGDTLVGKVIFDKCTRQQPKDIKLKIVRVNMDLVYTAFPTVDAEIEMNSSTGEHTILSSTGYYRFATRKLMLEPPEMNGLGLVYEIEGQDRHVVRIIQESTLESCAEFLCTLHTKQ